MKPQARDDLEDDGEVGSSSNSGAVIFHARRQGTVTRGGGERPRQVLEKSAKEVKRVTVGPHDRGSFTRGSPEGEATLLAAV
jgi:hypothetical protein